MTLEDLGWNPAFDEEFAPFRGEGWVPARLVRDNRTSYGALLENGDEVEAVVSGKVFHGCETAAELPAVGDWVALDVGGGDGVSTIRARLRRQTCLSRRLPGRTTEEQVIAANVSIVVVVTDAGPDFNLRRLERYFAIIGGSGSRAVVLVNKADLVEDSRNEEAAAAIRALNAEAEVHITSALHGTNLAALRHHLKPGVSITLVGSSGVGKSSVLNCLLGTEYQATRAISAVNHKGRHTTTARELIVLPDGGMLIDTPGIREVQLWVDQATVREGFADIDALATQCRFRDCAHRADADCAVRAAVTAGQLDAGRYQSYLKLGQEIADVRRQRHPPRMTLERRTQRTRQAKARPRVGRDDAEGS